MSAGHSGTPLPRKLGLKAGQTTAFLGLPEELSWLAEAEAFAAAHRHLDGQGAYDLIHAFHTEAAAMASQLDALRRAIVPSGAVWISWPKRASKVPTDITEDVVRAAAIDTGLVDVKVCAVSQVWSGLKLVIPVALREGRR